MTAVFDDGFPLMMEREAGMSGDIPPMSVAFGWHPMVDKAKSDAAGHEVYKDVEFVKIVTPGDRTSLYFQPATAEHKRRFPLAYDAFKKREGGEHVEGMRIEHWPAIPKSAVLTLKVLHIHTVEALAAVHDSHIDRLGSGGRELRDKARAWLTAAKDNAATTRLAEEKRALQDQLEGLKAQMAAMAEQMEAMQSKEAPTRQRRASAGA